MDNDLNFLRILFSYARFWRIFFSVLTMLYVGNDLMVDNLGEAICRAVGWGMRARSVGREYG